VLVLDRDTRKELCQIPCNGPITFAPSYFHPRHASAEVSRDGRHLALVSPADKRLEVFDTGTGKRLHTQKIDPYAGGSIISPDGKTLYIHDATGPIRRCELVSGKALPNLDGTTRDTEYLAASPDGKLVVTRGRYAEKDGKGNFVGVRREPFLMVCDAVANKTLGKLDIAAVPEHFAFAGPESVLAIVAKYPSPLPPVVTLERWNVRSFKREWAVPVASLRYPNQWLTVSADGKRVAITDRECSARVYDAATGKPVGEPTGHPCAVAWIGFAPNGEQIFTAAQDGIRAWTLKGELKSLARLPEIVRGTIDATQVG
jgi:WD40 repeat protein